MALERPARAVVDFARYLAVDAAKEPVRLRNIAALRLEQAKARTGVVALRLARDSGVEAVVVLTVRPVASTGEETVISTSALESRDMDRLLRLDPGEYHVTVTRDAGSRSEHEVTVQMGEEALLEIPLPPRAVATAPIPTPPPPRRPSSLAWVATTGSVGAAGVAVGLTLSALGWVRSERQLSVSPAKCSPIEALDRCRHNVAAAMSMRGAGAGLLGVGVGALVGGLTGLEPRTKRRILAWRVEAGLGGGVAIAGAIALGLGLRGFNQSNTDASADAALWGDDNYATRVSAQGRLYLLGAGLVGGGISLSVTALVALLVQRRPSDRAGLGPRWQVHGQGLAIKF